MIPLFSQKHTKEDVLTLFLLGKNEIMLLTYENKEEWFCFIQEANFHFINKQLLTYQIVTSCLRIARSYHVATTDVTINQFKTTTQWHRLIQPRSISTWPIYPTFVTLFSFIRENINKWLRRSIHFPLKAQQTWNSLKTAHGIFEPS